MQMEDKIRMIIADELKGLEIPEDIKKLLENALKAGVDASLVHIEKNLDTVDFNKFGDLVGPFAKALVGIVIVEIRKLLHGGLVSK